jgi:hypothetical protein
LHADFFDLHLLRDCLNGETPQLITATMKAAPLLVAWHDNTDPIYSAHFEPHGKGRLATAGGDSHVRVQTNTKDRTTRAIG